METKTSAYYQRLYRQRLREQGLVKKEVWILPEHTRKLLDVEKQLRQPSGMPLTVAMREKNMATTASLWTTNKLFDALSVIDLFNKDGGASVELVEGTDPSMVIIMHEFGDLPIFLSVVGEQIIVESILWPIDSVQNPQAFNEEILRAHKFFPLSTIGIERLAENDFYIMFGALSAESTLSNVTFEIEMLADNVIKATEAFESYLKV